MHTAPAAIVATRHASQKSADEQLRMFRNVVRSLAADATAALNQLETGCTDADQLEQCLLLRHYLDYMMRLCQGRV